MNEITNSNINRRLEQIKSQLGQLAYERRGHMIAVEKIDLQVTQMESQGILLEATKGDLTVDENNETGRQEAERANAKKERSERSKAAAQKRKRATTKAAPRKGKGPTAA